MGSIALMLLPFLLAKAPHGFDYHVSFKLSRSLSLANVCQTAFNSVCLPVRGKISSATAILRSVIILKNDVSMPACCITNARGRNSQLCNQQALMLLILQHYKVIQDQNCASSSNGGRVTRTLSTESAAPPSHSS